LKLLPFLLLRGFVNKHRRGYGYTDVNFNAMTLGSPLKYIIHPKSI
jgi:hypothetical protein